MALTGSSQLVTASFPGARAIPCSLASLRGLLSRWNIRGATVEQSFLRSLVCLGGSRGTAGPLAAARPGTTGRARSLRMDGTTLWNLKQLDSREEEEPAKAVGPHHGAAGGFQLFRKARMSSGAMERAFSNS